MYMLYVEIIYLFCVFISANIPLLNRVSKNVYFSWSDIGFRYKLLHKNLITNKQGKKINRFAKMNDKMIIY